MRYILFANQKGGVGKTLLADETAFYLENDYDITFRDLDQQGGANHKNDPIPHGDYMVIDTPGALNEEMNEWFDVADVIVIPTNCNSHDMAPLERMMEIAAEYDKEKIIIVFNRWNRFSGTAEFINWFCCTYPGFKTYLVPMSVALTDAAAHGMSINEYKPKHKAAAAINGLVELILKTLGE